MGVAPRTPRLSLSIFLILSWLPVEGKILSLSEATDLAKENSASVQAAGQELEAAKAQTASQNASFYPQFDFTGEYRYVGEIPSVKLGLTTMELANHNNYSIGPTMRYMLWDFGNRSATHESLKHLSAAKRWQHKAVEDGVELNAKIAYVDLQLATEKVLLAKEALELSSKQYQDIKSRSKVGGASDVDLISSQVEAENAKIRLLQEQATREVARTALVQMLGVESGSDFELDPLTQAVEQAVLEHGEHKVNAHPQLKVAEAMSNSMLKQTESIRAGYWPQIQMQARLGLDFPNGPVAEKVFQKTIGVGFTWTLWDWGMRAHSASQKAAQAQAIKFERENTERELTTNLKKSLATFSSFKEQKTSIALLVNKVEKLAAISQTSYELGKLSLTEVIATNLKRLEVKMRKAQNDALLLSAYYRIEHLSKKGDEG